jgi:cytochrome c oxidase subunit 6a
MQRRFNSAETKPSWLANNKFNRERAAVKEHAAGTSGTYFLDYPIILYWLRDVLIPDANSMAARPLEKAVHLVRLRPVQLELRRNTRCLTIHSAVIPCLILGGINAYNLWTEHWEHWNHLPPLEERVEYPYQNVRVKNFP